jgi:argininosuccinate lyase
MMPQKKNPDAFELIRGKAARLQGNLQTLLSLMKALPLTYNRDMQEDKPPVFDSFEQTKLCLHVLTSALKGVTFNTKNCAAALQDPYLLATDLVDYLVEKKVPFREAHHCVGQLVAAAEAHGVLLTELDDEEVASVHEELGPDWRKIFNVKLSLSKREGLGMPGPRQVGKQLARWRQLLK